MNVLNMLASRFADSGHQEVTATGTVIDASKGAIKCSISGGGNIYLPRIAEAGHLPFFLTATEAGNQVILENLADDATPDTVTTLSSTGITSALIWHDGYEWRAMNLTQYASNTLLGTILTRNAATGIIQVTDSATLTASGQIVDLADDSVGGNAYTIKLPSPETLLAMPMLLLVSASNALVVTVQNSAAGAVGTITKGKEAGGIAYSDGTNTYLFPFMLHPVCGPASATDGDFARYDGTTGELLKGGVALVTSIAGPGSDSEVPSEQAIVEYVAATSAPLQTANAAIIADAHAIPATQFVSIITNADANTIVLPLASTAVGRMYFIKTTVDEDTAVNEHATDGGSTIVTLKSSAIASAILCCDGTNWHEIHDT